MTRSKSLAHGVRAAAIVFLAPYLAMAQFNKNTLRQVDLGLNNNPPSSDRRLTRSVTQSLMNRKLFALSYAATPVVYNNGSTTWNLIVVTDPLWNRLVYGDYNRWIKTYGSWGSGSGQFSHPHGIDRNPYGTLYVADTGNNRVVILKINWVKNGSSTYNTYISYSASIGGLKIPNDVAWDDNGTPTDVSDDYLWIADTGNNRILKYRMYDDVTFSLERSYGTYGTGTGQFRNPIAIAVGRTYGVNDNNVYVADMTNQRIVRLEDGASSITWENTYNESNLVHYTSVETDWYGGLWITDDFNHRIRKLDRYLSELDTYGSYGLGQTYGLLYNPSDYSIYFSLEKINGVNTWIGHDASFLCEGWGDNAGAVCYEMGTELNNVDVDIQPCEDPNLTFLPPRVNELGKINRPEICPTYCTYFLTDYSKVYVTVHRVSDNQQVRMLVNYQTRSYGQHSEYWNGMNDQGIPVGYTYYYFKVDATAMYTGASAIIKTSPSFLLKPSINQATDEAPKSYALLQSYPNPFNPQTVITYQVPRGAHVKIIIHDLLGRRVKILVDERKDAGEYKVAWDGRDNDDNPVGSGVFFYRMQSDDFVSTRKITLIR